MEIKRKEVIEVTTTDGKQINVGDLIVVSAYGKSHIGTFVGVSNRDSIILGNYFDGEPSFNISAKVIKSIEFIDIA